MTCQTRPEGLTVILILFLHAQIHQTPFPSAPRAPQFRTRCPFSLALMLLSRMYSVLLK